MTPRSCAQRGVAGLVSCSPPSPRVAGLAAWRAGGCGRCPARSPRGCCRSPAGTASSPGRRRRGRSFSSEWWSSHRLKSPCHRTPEAEGVPSPVRTCPGRQREPERGFPPFSHPAEPGDVCPSTAMLAH